MVRRYSIISIIRKKFGFKIGFNLFDVFSYNSPVVDGRLFFGELNIIKNIYATLLEPGTQILFYGEPKVGKTSIANNMHYRKESCFLRIQCNDLTTSAELLSCILAGLNKKYWKRRTYNTKLDGRIDFGIKTPFMRIYDSKRSTYEISDTYVNTIDKVTINDAVGAIHNSNAIVFIDDLERVTDNEIFLCLGNIAKGLADNSPKTANGTRTYGKLLCSYATPRPTVEFNNLKNTFGVKHNPIKMFRVPRMTSGEIRRLIKFGMELTLLKIADDVVEKIVLFARGFPGMAKYACLRIGCEIADIEGKEDYILTGKEQTANLRFYNSRIRHCLSTLSSNEILNFHNYSYS